MCPCDENTLDEEKLNPFSINGRTCKPLCNHPTNLVRSPSIYMPHETNFLIFTGLGNYQAFFHAINANVEGYHVQPIE
jgi:hypothetical protein